MKRSLLGRNLLVSLFLVVAIWLPRGLALDRLVTPDEPTWLTNSANFYAALAHGDFDATYQIEHPGVTTMWIGTAAFLWRYPDYPLEGPGQITWWVDEVGPYLLDQGYQPLDLLVPARFGMVIAITLVLLAAFWVGVRLLGFWAGLAGFAIIATDPFHIAHSRLLHLDGLASSLTLLALLSFLTYLYRGSIQRDLAISGTATGLAWLTKSPTLFLIPFCGLLLFIELLRRKPETAGLRVSALLRAVKMLAGWGGTGLAVFVLLWPAMWVDPLFTVWRVLRAMVGYAEAGHEAAIFFSGAIVDGDPGVRFYPITYLWRTTPVVLAGLGLLLIIWLGSRWQPQNNAHSPSASIELAESHVPVRQWRVVGTLVLFAALFTLFMSLGAKKFDRYLLPVYLPLDLAAGCGWATAGQLLRREGKRLRVPVFLARVVPFVIGALILIGQSASAISSFPYYLSHYNPLLGGTAAAPRVMMVGWGEGLDQSARFLNSLPGASNLRVTTSVWNGTFSYFFKGQTLWSEFTPNDAQVQEWTASDFYVVYINQRQRGRLPGELLAYLNTLPLALSVRLQGLEYVRVYDLRAVPPPPYLTQDDISAQAGSPSEP